MQNSRSGPEPTWPTLSRRQVHSHAARPDARPGTLEIVSHTRDLLALSCLWARPFRLQGRRAHGRWSSNLVTDQWDPGETRLTISQINRLGHRLRHADAAS